MSFGSKPSYSCYFASRSELLGWVNRELDLKLSKIEEVATGAAYCQLMDRLYPGKVKMMSVCAPSMKMALISNSRVLIIHLEENGEMCVQVPMKRVNFSPRSTNDYIANFKVSFFFLL